MLQLWNFIYPNSSNSESYSAKKARLVTAMSTSPHPEPLAPYLDFTKNITILDLTDATGQCFRAALKLRVLDKYLDTTDGKGKLLLQLMDVNCLRIPATVTGTEEIQIYNKHLKINGICQLWDGYVKMTPAFLNAVHSDKELVVTAETKCNFLDADDTFPRKPPANYINSNLLRSVNRGAIIAVVGLIEAIKFSNAGQITNIILTDERGWMIDVVASELPKRLAGTRFRPMETIVAFEGVRVTFGVNRVQTFSDTLVTFNPQGSEADRIRHYMSV